ncbi:hypothetical protein FISHEDRAFT_54137 [Fistulina hepatica ATCC 64428]|uniref:Uncharacterized protein n=1 Tax=Fistulina hepatica ATCC 64428 TaxID=1128425 RepID=A0A0D6ZZW9_9AGAR|nr:hypothetical protein FISHEDRAFT_54137 [Fistulina hepatica ATCC 64428]
MIARGHRSAPQFTKDMTRNPLYLERYFKELEAALANAHITESRRKKEYAVHYPDVEQAEAWKALTEYDSDESDYDTFKKAICRIYFGDTGRLYRSHDLEALCEEYRQKGFDTIGEFRDFHQKFLSIYKYLTNTSDYSEREASHMIWRAFDPRLTQAVQTRLDIKCPDANDDIYPLEEVIAAAKFCCRGGKQRSMMTTLSARTISPNEGGMVKIEDVSTLVSKIMEGHMPPPNGLPPHLALYNAAPRPRPGPEHPCNFCGGTNHFINNCEVCRRYLMGGRCTRSCEGRIVLPSRGAIQQINMLDTEKAGKGSKKVQFEAGPSKAHDGKAQDPAYCLVSGLNGAEALESVTCAMLEERISISQGELLAIAPDLRRQIREIVAMRRVATTSQAPRVIGNPPTESTTEPAAPVLLQADKGAGKETFIGDTSSTDPIVAHYARNTGPPAPIPEPFYAGADFVTICTVNNREEVESILDHGSQIVAVSATCSKKLGLAYNPDISVQLQSANGEFNRTLGVAHNVPFKFESVKVYLQCHVVETNAYEILLGRLFFALTTCIMNTHLHQDETITITDPNSHKCLTLPTYSRGEARYAHYAAKVGKDTATKAQEQAEGFRPAST